MRDDVGAGMRSLPKKTVCLRPHVDTVDQGMFDQTRSVPLLLSQSVSVSRRRPGCTERERENFICQVTTNNNFLSIIIYNGRLPEKANAHQCWPPLTQ